MNRADLLRLDGIRHVVLPAGAAFLKDFNVDREAATTVGRHALQSAHSVNRVL
jgi:hypothetical protein